MLLFLAQSSRRLCAKACSNVLRISFPGVGGIGGVFPLDMASFSVWSACVFRIRYSDILRNRQQGLFQSLRLRHRKAQLGKDSWESWFPSCSSESDVGGTRW